MKLIPKYLYAGPINLISINPKSLIKELSKTIQDRLYESVGARWGYEDWKQALLNILTNTKKPKDDKEADTLFATYLNIDPSKRHYKNSTLSESSYKPTHSSLTSKYYTVDLSNSDKELLINEANGILQGIISKRNKIFYGYRFNPSKWYSSDGLELYDGTPLKFGLSKNSKVLGFHNLGTHTISKGVDPNKGEYVSYYDKWDINPFKGYWGERNNNLITRALGLNKKDNIDSIGTPVEFYDRIYLDDYYGVNSGANKGDYYGGYLPELNVYGK